MQTTEQLLKEAGWALDQPRDREFEVTGMPNAEGRGFVDYVLWGDDGKPLGLVEGKRTRSDPRVGQQQARLYADCLEKQFGQRPLIFYSNGYEHGFWDDTNYPPRAVQGFYKKSELELLVQRRVVRKSLDSAEIDRRIVDRYYQTRGIRRVAAAFEQDHERKALLVMATGAGKTRTVIALADLLMRCNWVKRVLFLVDRVALVNQAVEAFKAYLPDCSPVNLVTEKGGEGRVFVSTYPTMMGLIDEARDGQRRFGVGHFDLVIIDEAHRSVFQKYRAIFDYFDSLLVGLTATPKDEVNRNTYGLFNLEGGVPTDAYSLEEAVNEGFLVPPRPVSAPLGFRREGVCYDELSEQDKDQWDALEWDDEGSTSDRIEAEAGNEWLFNQDTVDSVLQHLMCTGLHVAGGDRLGKTIIFAKNQAHADFIADRFNVNYPHYRGDFARVITFKTEYAQTLIDNFSAKDKAPHIAISVDMLDTGIDVPEVVNLVFFKLVRSKTKFWQMIGRGTRLCPNLFGPGQDKEFFFLFDYGQNLEYFNYDQPAGEGRVADSLGARLFKSRLELIGELDQKLGPMGSAGVADSSNVEDTRALLDKDVRRLTAAKLYEHVAAMNVQNFVVRPKRTIVEQYSKREAWGLLPLQARSELARDVASLPTELDPEGEEAKRFDLLVLDLQLARLRADRSFEGLRDQVKGIAAMLEERASIPLVNARMPLILDLQTEVWWQDVTVPMLEGVRRRLRELVHLIEKAKRKILYSACDDEISVETSFDLPGTKHANDYAKFCAKAQAFLRSHQDHVAIRKLRINTALTATDLAEIERMLLESGIGAKEQIVKAASEAHGLGLFVRSLVGLDRGAAKDAFGTFVSGRALGAHQIKFVNLIVNHLTEHGVMDPERLYESPFTDLAPSGPDGLFDSIQVDELIAILGTIRATAVAA